MRTSALLASLVGWLSLGVPWAAAAGPEARVLDPSAFAARIGGEEGRWLAPNVPAFDCTDPGFRAIYDFRWRVFKEHIRPTPDGFVVTEFLPDVP